MRCLVSASALASLVIAVSKPGLVIVDSRGNIHMKIVVASAMVDDQAKALSF